MEHACSYARGCGWELGWKGEGGRRRRGVVLGVSGGELICRVE
jgi:hypothetical protein